MQILTNVIIVPDQFRTNELSAQPGYFIGFVIFPDGKVKVYKNIHSKKYLETITEASFAFVLKKDDLI